LKIFQLLIAVLVLISCPAGPFFICLVKNDIPSKGEAASTSNNLSNLDESISHDGQKNIEPVIKDEPIRPGKNEIVALKKKLKPKKSLIVHASGYYTPERGQRWYLNGSYEKERKVNGRGAVTKSGNIPQEWKTIAADPKILPLGTKISIECFEGIFEVEDIGEYIKGHRIDVYTGRGTSALKEAMNIPKKMKIKVYD
jgi:3D (Asp-Asp-Asp) domain-containing protein